MMPLIGFRKATIVGPMVKMMTPQGDLERVRRLLKLDFASCSRTWTFRRPALTMRAAAVGKCSR